MKCVFCNRDINDCRVDSRGLCVKSPLSSGKRKKRTKRERESDKHT